MDIIAKVSSNIDTVKHLLAGVGGFKLKQRVS